MKKVLIFILAVVLSFSVFAMVACQQPCETHLDGNHDGICDICDTEGLTVTHTDSNHDGKCDAGCGATVEVNHVDAAHDGRCDVCNRNVEIVHTDANSDGTCDVCNVLIDHTHADANNDGACDVPTCNYEFPWVANLAAAKTLVNDLYLKEATLTPGDYTLTTTVNVVGVGAYSVTWTVEVAEADKDVVKLGEPGQIKVNNKVDHDVDYKIVAVIADAEGHSTTVSFDRKVPQFAENTFAEYAAAEDGDYLVVKGIVVAIVSKDLGDTDNSLYIVDNDGGYYIYGLTALPEGVKVGDTIRASGSKKTYNGTYELVDATVEIVDATTSMPEPKDFTDLYKAAAVAGGLSKPELVAPQAQLVTIKGVTVKEIGGSKNDYYHFELDGLKSYVRISSSNCPLNAADTATFIAEFPGLFGMTADVTGVISLYSGNFYLTPISVDAFSNAKLPELSDAEKVAFEKDALVFETQIVEDGSIELPSAGAAYNTVAIAWDFKAETAHDCATIADGKLNVTLPSEATTITLVATLTCGTETATKEFVVAVDAASAMPYIYKPISAPVAGTFKIVMNTTPANGKPLYFVGTLNSKGALETTDKPEKAVDVVVSVLDATAGTYSLKVADKYLEGYLNGTYKNLRLVDTAAAWTWNAEAKVFVCDIDGVKYYFGDRDRGGYANDTMALSDIKFITGNNLSKIGVSQFVGQFVSWQFVQEGGSTGGETGGETPAPHTCESVCPTCQGCLDADCTETACATKCEGHDAPAHTCESVCEECGKCKDAACEETACAEKCEGHEPSVITSIADALAAADGAAVELTGTVTGHYNGYKSNFYIKDEDGHSILVYYSTADAEIGDVVKVVGVLASFNGTKQVAKGSTFTVITAHECSEYSDATCTEAQLCVVCGEVKAGSTALGHTEPNAEGKCDTCGADLDTSSGWILVTDVSTLAAGDQIVIVAKDANYALGTNQKPNNRGTGTVTKDGSKVILGSDVQVITLEAGKTAGTFAFNVGNGYLYAASSSKNYLKVETSLSANSSWKIEIAATGVATIKSQGSNSRNWLRYNASNNPPLFSCYGSGQTDVCIYKLVGSAQ